MALSIIRTATGATIDTSYSSLSANLASSLSSSFVVPSGVSAIKHISVSVATDDVTERVRFAGSVGMPSAKVNSS